MQILHDKLQICISPWFCVSTAVMILFVPFSWVFAWLCAAFIHEMGHYVAIKLSGNHVFRVRVGYGGALMETDLIGGRTELISAIAGPAFGACTIFLSRWFPRLAVCAFIQTAYNLLPINCLDGGRILLQLLEHIFSSKCARHIFSIVTMIVLLILTALSILAFFLLESGLFPVIGMLVLGYRSGFIKFPCKAAKQIVQ